MLSEINFATEFNTTNQYNMRKITIAFTLSLLLLPLCLTAQNPTSGNKTEIKHRPGSTNRPSVPSNEDIDIFINENTLIFDLPEYVEYMTVELKKGDVVVLTGMVDHEDASINVAGFQGEYEILCRTDGNQLFAGNIEL